MWAELKTLRRACRFPVEDRAHGYRLLQHIPVPIDLLTNVAFGGPDLKTLYITAGGTLFKVQTKTAELALNEGEADRDDRRPRQARTVAEKLIRRNP